MSKNPENNINFTNVDETKSALFALKNIQIDSSINDLLINSKIPHAIN